jgi:hypothetical protein
VSSFAINTAALGSTNTTVAQASKAVVAAVLVRVVIVYMKSPICTKTTP